MYSQFINFQIQLVIMDKNCLNQKNANARGVLQPIILRAILNLYQRGHSKMTANEVKKECYLLDDTKNWDGRLPAICNAMRNTINCTGRIVGEDRDFLNFTIAF